MAEADVDFNDEDYVDEDGDEDGGRNRGGGVVSGEDETVYTDAQQLGEGAGRRGGGGGEEGVPLPRWTRPLWWRSIARL